MKYKFNFEQKLSAVKRILLDDETISSVARSIGAGYTPVKRWLNRYEQHGEEGLKPVKGIYTSKYKLEVIEYMLKNELPLMRTAAFFGIPSETTISLWLKQYRSSGKAGLSDTYPKEQTMTKKTKNNITSRSTSSLEDKLAALQRENEYLRTENALLKKLDALIQEEEVARKQSKSQKPSKN